MRSEPVSGPHKPDSLSVIHEGMKVVDAGGKHIGKVSGLYLGATGDTVEQPNVVPETSRGTASVADGVGNSMVEPLDPDGTLPEVIRRRLRYNGFVRIDAGALHRDRYALREQVATVAGDEVRLNVPADDLIKV